MAMTALADWPELDDALLLGDTLLAATWVAPPSAAGAAELAAAEPSDDDSDDLLLALCADAHGATGVGERTWRCLDASHGAPCSRCTPPPSDADSGRFALRGDAKSRVNGEKKLRSLLCRAAEWSDASAREAAALLAEAEGVPELPDALRRRDISALRKRGFLALCRYWGYRSCVWASVERAAPARRRPAPLEVGRPRAPRRPRALVAPPLSPDAAGDAVRRDLHALVAAFVRAVAMPQLCEAVARDMCSPIATIDLQTAAATSAATRGLEAQARRDGATLRELHAALQSAGDGALPAWRLGPRGPPLGEAVLQSLLLLAHALAAALADARDPRGGIEATLGRPLNALERAHFADNAAACDAVHRALAAAQGALAQQRLGRGGDYLSAAVAVLAAVEAMCGAVHRGMAERDHLVRFRVVPHPWKSTMMLHARTGAAPAAGAPMGVA